MFSAENLSIGYNKGTSKEKVLFSGLTFSLEKGALTCLVGPNGAGKSTLLRTLSGSQPAIGGILRFDGRDIASFSQKELARKIGLVLTDRTGAGGLSVRELVSLGRYPYTGFWGRLSAEDEKIIEESMEKTGIADKADRYISELSDGERQKVMIAKAIAQECPVIILDEPTAFLDITSKMDVMYLLHGMAARGRTVLLSTHDMDQVMQLADNVWIMKRESGIISGTPEELAMNGEIDRTFGNGISVFDSCSGRFLKRNSHSLKFSIDAEPEYRHWIENILRRYGMSIADNTTDNITASVAAHDSNILLTDKDNTRSFSSPGDFARYIKDTYSGYGKTNI